MGRLDRATPLGRLAVVGARPEVLQAAAELALAEAAREGPRVARIEFLGRACWWKRGFLAGRSRMRWGLKRLVLRARLPRVQEYHNLCWLTERLFCTPRPLAAGGLFTGGFPRFQFLLTEDVPDAPTLEAKLADRADPDRGPILRELAREVARMHALGFVHHDLYPRNVLVAPRGSLQRIVFLDAWAGGPGPNLRGADYDLACLLLRAEEQLGDEERSLLLDTYARERAAQGRPIAGGSAREPLPDAFVRRIASARRALARRLAERPAERRGQDTPRLTW